MPRAWIEATISDALATGPKRSQAYRQGVFDGLQGCVTGSVAPCPYREGSPKCDAYIAGMERAHHIWLELGDSCAFASLAP